MKCQIHYWEDATFRCLHCRRPFCGHCQVILAGHSYCQNCGQEEEKMMALRGIVDTAALLIQTGRLSKEQAERLVENVKDRVLELFPGKQDLFELIYRARFNRLAKQFSR